MGRRSRKGDTILVDDEEETVQEKEPKDEKTVKKRFVVFMPSTIFHKTKTP